MTLPGVLQEIRTRAAATREPAVVRFVEAACRQIEADRDFQLRERIEAVLAEYHNIGSKFDLLARIHEDGLGDAGFRARLQEEFRTIREAMSGAQVQFPPSEAPTDGATSKAEVGDSAPSAGIDAKPDSAEKNVPPVPDSQPPHTDQGDAPPLTADPGPERGPASSPAPTPGNAGDANTGSPPASADESGAPPTVPPPPVWGPDLPEPKRPRLLKRLLDRVK